MIIRKRKRPMTLQKVEAIIPRLRRHIPELHAEEARQLAGYRGEQKLDYYLNFLPQEFSILNDVGLKVKGNTFQIDSLIITNRAIFPLDSKNYKGLVTFDTEMKQCIRENDGTLEGFNYPLTQLENNEFLLSEWLQERNLLGLPIYSHIAFAYSYGIIKVVGDQNIKQKITYADAVPNLLREKQAALQQSNPVLKGKIIHALMEACVDFSIDVMQKYGIRKEEILPGVMCSNCKRLDMRFHQGIWKCPHCKSRSKTAHEQAWRDYFLLINDEISNEECCKFWKTGSRHKVKRLLKKCPDIELTSKRTWVMK